MIASAHVAVVACTHADCPLEVRERVALNRESRRCARILLHGITRLEVLVLSTCNRTEVILIAPGSAEIPRDSELRTLFRSTIPGAESLGDEYLRVFEGEAALVHLLRLATGLDSMILGEVQILTQIRDQFSEARGDGTTGPALSHLVDSMVACGRHVRHRTGLSRESLGIPRAVVSRIEQHIGHGFTIGIIGRSEIANQLARKLRMVGCTRLISIHRCSGKARTFASHIGAEPYTLQELPQVLESLDVLVAAAPTGLSYLLSPPKLTTMSKESRLRMVLDLSVPRTLSSDWLDLPSVIDYQDLETLSCDYTKSHQPDPLVLSAAEALVLEHGNQFVHRMGDNPVAHRLEDCFRPLLRAFQAGEATESDTLQGLAAIAQDLLIPNPAVSQ